LAFLRAVLPFGFFAAWVSVFRAVLRFGFPAGLLVAFVLAKALGPDVFFGLAYGVGHRKTT
jgi:hypothetical protein